MKSVNIKEKNQKRKGKTKLKNIKQPTGLIEREKNSKLS
jgi:hypothetical protein